MAKTKEVPEDGIGQLCANVVAKYTQPQINARTMLSMPAFWADIVRALRGEAPEPAPVAEPVAEAPNKLAPGSLASFETPEEDAAEDFETKTGKRKRS